MLELTFKRGGKTHDINLPDNATVYDLKLAIEKITHVKPEEQKLLGVSQPRDPAPEDHDPLEAYSLKKKTPIMMMQIVDQYRKHPTKTQATAALPQQPAPLTPAEKIATIQGKLDDLTTQIEEIETKAASNSEEVGALKSSLAKHTEFLTQTLISLDGIDAVSEREKRREQIKRIHTMQDKIDSIKSKL